MTANRTAASPNPIAPASARERFSRRSLNGLSRLTQLRRRGGKVAFVQGDLESALGPVWYGRALAFALWGPQIVLGRLVPVLYVLVKRP